ncbi:MAG TPA: sigma factor-like helix-turn-helix DNA-binding protein [Streptosporangiaceae bacterium]|jgi:RNA polymerase sigma-B factor|nr:sigma factor-like helix-turn-helix DNA-binding protein [Streptosporangiaceae bacterium]
MALDDRSDHADPPSDAGKPAACPPSAGPSAGPDPTLVLEALRAQWGELSGLDQKLLLMRFFGNMTQDEIGGQLGIPPCQVAQLLRRALDALHERRTEPEPEPAPEPGSAA